MDILIDVEKLARMMEIKKRDIERQIIGEIDPDHIKRVVVVDEKSKA